MLCSNRADTKNEMLFSWYHNGGCFLCCLWITSWLGMSMGNYQDLLLCLSYSFAFFHCRTAFNYHTESPFTEIMRKGDQKLGKLPITQLSAIYCIQEKQNPMPYPFVFHPYVLINRDKYSTVAYRSLLEHLKPLIGHWRAEAWINEVI